MTTQATLYVDQGTDFLISLELSQDTGGDFVISDQTFYCDVKKLYSTSKLFSANVDIVTGDGGNDINLVIGAESTRNITPGKYQYDLLMVNSSGGGVEKILEGLLIITPTITVPGV
jgi:hypothetical protein